MNCPICDGKLKHTNNIKEGEEIPSFVEVKVRCTKCKKYKYELWGPSKTTWINGNEYYDLYYEHKKNKISRIIFWVRLKYKVSNFFKKLTIKY